MHNPTVGEILWYEFMHPNNITIDRLAKSMNVQYQRVSNIINNRKDVTEYMDRKLSERFGTSIGYWLKLQEEYKKASKRK